MFKRTAFLIRGWPTLRPPATSSKQLSGLSCPTTFGTIFSLHTKTQSTTPGSDQSAQGKNIQEVSYQEGSKDHISHMESSRFHFIKIHQGTGGAMLTLIILFGLLLCSLRFLRFQFLRPQQLRNLRELFFRGYQNPDGNLHEMNDMAGRAGTYQWHKDPEFGQIAIQEVHGDHSRVLPYLREICTRTSDAISKDRRCKVGCGGYSALPGTPRYWVQCSTSIRLTALLSNRPIKITALLFIRAVIITDLFLF